jgi:LysR family transcriptional regulator, nitrogen assimilation regulatory protein
MNFKQLEYFVQVAELGSFSKAALMLDIAQPALSRQVRALEIELHETLLLRNGRGVSLTDAGQRLFEHSVDILQRVSSARDDMGASRDEPVGRVVVGLPPSVGRQLTMPLIDHFRSQLPKARLAIVEGLSTHIAEWIGTGRVDLGVLHNPEAHPALELMPLLEEPLCLVQKVAVRKSTTGKRRSGVTSLPPLAMRELPRYPLIMPERIQSIRRLIETQAALAGIRLDIAWEVSGISSIIDLVCAGYGNAVLTRSGVIASGRADQLSVRPLIEPAVTSVLCLAASASKRPGALTRHVAAQLAGFVKALVEPGGTTLTAGG